MTRPPTTDHAITDEQLLGAALGDVRPWSTWLAVLKAAFALGLNDDERSIFQQVAGNREAADQARTRIVVRLRKKVRQEQHGGSARDFSSMLRQASTGCRRDWTCSVLAMSRDQAKLVFQYALGFLESSPVLKQEIDSITANEIRLRNGIISARMQTASDRCAAAPSSP
jgi:hypothetical protein